MTLCHDNVVVMMYRSNSGDLLIADLTIIFVTREFSVPNNIHLAITVLQIITKVTWRKKLIIFRCLLI